MENEIVILTNYCVHCDYFMELLKELEIDFKQHYFPNRVIISKNDFNLLKLAANECEFVNTEEQRRRCYSYGWPILEELYSANPDIYIVKV